MPIIIRESRTSATTQTHPKIKFQPKRNATYRNWIAIAMTSALIALIRYSRESDGPTVEIAEALRSTGATLFSVAQNGAESLPKSCWVSTVQRSFAGSPGFESVLTRASATPTLVSAATSVSFATGLVNFTVTSVPPVNDSPSRSGEPSFTQWKPMKSKPAKMTAYEIAETVRNHPTTFQLRRRKNI